MWNGVIKMPNTAFDSTPPSMYINPGFGCTVMNPKAKTEDHTYWENSIYAAWFALGIRVAWNHATG